MRETRLYGLFEKRPEGWVRVAPTLAFKKSTAVRVFQNALLASVMGGCEYVRELKVVRD